MLSNEHFITVDSALIEAYACHKHFKPKDEKEGERESSHTRKCVNETRESTINLDSHVCRKSEDKDNKLSYMGHAIMENRNDLAIAGFFEEASAMTELVASEGIPKKNASQFVIFLKLDL